MKRLSLAIGLALFLALPATAQTYKWVDANGEVHYSDKPPPSDIKTETLQVPAEPAAAPAASTAEGGGAKSLAEQDQAFRKRQADAAKEEAEQAGKEAQARSRAEYCKSAKAALTNLELGGRQLRINDKGERVFLTDEEITQETAQARKDAAAACN